MRFNTLLADVLGLVCRQCIVWHNLCVYLCVCVFRADVLELAEFHCAESEHFRCINSGLRHSTSEQHQEPWAPAAGQRDAGWEPQVTKVCPSVRPYVRLSVSLHVCMCVLLCRQQISSLGLQQQLLFLVIYSSFLSGMSYCNDWASGVCLSVCLESLLLPGK